ncbi:hypothetical protein [Streptomyces scabiei]|uniref:WXG100 family type VII secretion target n=1 Tax=Streptomyces TaxID=1883 RepID=UPI0029AD93B5|nr:hypothetical protein [Streptomyces scabiei]MDX3116941.1 hypothetical protein [Streptomyces scabiei]
MSGDKKTPDHYQAERRDAAQQNTGVDDAVNKAAVVSPPPAGSPGGFGRTSFEGYDLNAMIDIVESASPETLESAATALVDARDAINDAADELSRNLGDVDWKGEAHTAFYTWGMNLTTTALALAGYTDEVGTQVLAASSGLASVRKSMPPRDGRTAPKTIDDIPETERVDSNDEYTAAVTAEKHRQEAINQMYRLASFYTVSSGMMELAQEPVFPEMPSVGVPEPPPGYGVPYDPKRGEEALPAVSDPGTTRHHSENTGAKHISAEASQSPHPSTDETVTLPEQHVGTEIDSVGTLPSQDTVKPTTVPPSSPTGPSATHVGTVPPFAPPGVHSTSSGGAGRTPGFRGGTGSRLPTSAQGRVGGTPGGNEAGRTGSRAVGSPGRSAAAGKPGGRTADPMGRGVVGGAPKAGGQAAGRAGSPRGPVTGTGATSPGRPGAGRAGDGIVGGRPVTGGASRPNGSRLPRGTVVGGEGAPGSRVASERPGRRGAVGTPSSTAGPASGQATRRPVGIPDGVVGTPKGRVPGSGSNGNPPRGLGAPLGSGRNPGANDKRSRRNERRDDASAND